MVAQNRRMRFFQAFECRHDAPRDLRARSDLGGRRQGLISRTRLFALALTTGAPALVPGEPPRGDAQPSSATAGRTTRATLGRALEELDPRILHSVLAEVRVADERRHQAPRSFVFTGEFVQRERFHAPDVWHAQLHDTAKRPTSLRNRWNRRRRRGWDLRPTRLAAFCPC